MPCGATTALLPTALSTFTFSACARRSKRPTELHFSAVSAASDTASSQGLPNPNPPQLGTDHRHAFPPPGIPFSLPARREFLFPLNAQFLFARHPVRFRQQQLRRSRRPHLDGNGALHSHQPYKLRQARLQRPHFLPVPPQILHAADLRPW